MTKKLRLIVFLLLGLCSSFLAKAGVPKISYFSPTSGPAGTEVTISGSYFSYTLSDNIVYFGTVKAQVTYADMSVLKVLVPGNASSVVPITVTVGGLVATSTTSSTKTFNVTFPGGTISEASYTASTFEMGVVVKYAKAGDVNRDGLVDIIAAGSQNSISLALRNSTNTSFNTPVTYSCGSDGDFALADFNGDGYLDIAITIKIDDKVAILLNNGDGTFASPILWPTADGPSRIVTEDFNKDGRMDIATGNNYSISVLYANQVGGGFDAPINLNLGTSEFVQGIHAGDINGDKYIDLIALHPSKLTVIEGTSGGGFNSGHYFTLAPAASSLDLGDFNGDSKPDVVIEHNDGISSAVDQVSVLLNTESQGTFSFATPVNISLDLPKNVIVTDLNGDGKQDINAASSNSNIGGFHFLPGNGAGGFSTSQHLYQEYFTKVSVADFNRDGQADVLGYRNELSYVTIYTYKPSIQTGAVSTSVCSGASISVPFTANGIFNSTNVFTAQLSDATGSFASAVDIGSLSGTSSGTINATIPSSTAFGSGYRIRVVSSNPSINGTDNGTNITINVLSTAPTSITGPDYVCEGGSATLSVSGGSLAPDASWKWYSGSCGGTAVGTTSSITVTPSATTDYYVRAEGTCNTTGCISKTVTVDPYKTVSVSIAASPSSTVCLGTNVTFTATPVNGGSNPSYQWFLNGSMVGSNSDTYSNASLVNNDKVWCEVTSNALCISGSPAASSSQITIALLSSMVVSLLSQEDETCGPDGVTAVGGSLSISATGGITPYTFFGWDLNNDGYYNDAYGTEVNNLPAGTYKVLVIDAVGCEMTRSFTIAPRVPMAATLAIVNECKAEASVTGGEPPYIFSWSMQVSAPGGGTTYDLIYTETTSGLPSTATNLPSGTYRVQVKDANGCFVYTPEVDIKPDPGPRTYEICLTWRGSSSPPPPPVNPETPPTEVEVAVADITNALNTVSSSCQVDAAASLKEIYFNSCLRAENISDNLKVTYPVNQTHYTLYYYDRAGNLTKTVPPQGVVFLPATATRTDHPAHAYKTTYGYNSLKQLQVHNTVDGGEIQYMYNNVGQLRFSQNAKQLLQLPQLYSYTKYDELGRVLEVGESQLATGNFADLTTNLNDAAYPQSSNSQRTYTVYSRQASGVSYYGSLQRFLQNRVSHTFTDDGVNTYYSYDPHGNVEWLVQDYPGLGRNYVRYEYDLISGNVKQVIYNEYRNDKFFHRYQYDRSNRITGVETSADGVIWEKDAEYRYYLHGPLSRATIGEDRIQGLDYTYTIQGWLKAINHPYQSGSDYSSAYDPGKDGYSSGYERDVFGMTLGYYQGDFVHSNFNGVGNNLTAYNNYNTANDLYNGNISTWTSALFPTQVNPNDQVNNTTKGLMAGSGFRYDQLNRIVHSDEQGSGQAGFWINPNASYNTDYVYDANGNITNLVRNAYGSGDIGMDNLEYNYTTGSNRLQQVTDNSISALNGTMNDITGTHAYTYDGTGNLIKDAGEGIDRIDWTVYGKIKQVEPVWNSADPLKQKPRMRFSYDASGSRIMKEVNKVPFDNAGVVLEAPENIETTYYVRDAAGNPLGTYERTNQLVTSNTYNADYILVEQPLYGSDRLGLRDVMAGNPASPVASVSFTSGQLPAVPDHSGAGTMIKAEPKHLLSAGNEVKTLSSGLKIKTAQVKDIATTGTVTAVIKNQFPGEAGNALAVAEDKNGNLDFYAVTAKEYQGTKNICLVYDRNGKLMPGATGMFADAESKPHIVKVPGNNRKYYLLTRTLSGQIMYHVIDMGLAGNGTTANPSGNVESGSINKALQGATNAGRNMAVVENNRPEGVSKLFITRYAPPAGGSLGTTAITAYSIDEQSGITGPVMYGTLGDEATLDQKGDGELVISKDGSRLALYAFKQQVGFLGARAAHIATWTLDDNFNLSAKLTAHTVSGGSVPSGSSLDFSHNSSLVYYSQYTSSAASGKKIMRYNYSGQSLIMIMNKYGPVRRSNNDRVYVAQPQSTALDFIQETGSETYSTGIQSIGSAFPLAGLSVRPHRLYRNSPVPEEGSFTRYVDQKQYELKDHLGNVRAVVSDRKAATIAPGTITNAAEVLSYNNYYPFGMMMPGRSYSPTGYRYGFNGQESVDEISGVKNHYTAPFWEYDPRTGRRWNTDPVIAPWESPYAVNRNNPIALNDPFGDCPDCDKDKPDAKAGDTYRPKGAEHDYLKGDDGAWTMLGGNLSEVTVTADAGSGGGSNWTSEVNEWDYGGTYDQYKRDYPEFGGMSQSEASAYWNTNYSDAFFKQWEADVQKERDRVNLQKLSFFVQGFTTAGAMGMGALAGSSNLATPRTFSYTPRFQSSSTSESVWGYYGFEGATIKYVGISNNPSVRFNVHLNSGTLRATLDYRPILRLNTRLDARIWEQQNINNYGLKNLLNQRNEIRPGLWQKYGIE